MSREVSMNTWNDDEDGEKSSSTYEVGGLGFRCVRNPAL
jgi:hypothetical protein